MIFTGGRADDYPHAPVCGLVITARCDLANEKVPKLTYLPVVRLRDWVFQDAARIILRRCSIDQRNRIFNILKRYNLHCGVYETEDIHDICTLLSDQTSKNAQKDREKLLQEHALKIVCDDETRCADERLRTLYDPRRSIVQQVFNEMINNNLPSFYYIERVSVDPYFNDDTGHVILLREARNIPSDIAILIHKGFSTQTLYQQSVNSARLREFLDLEAHDHVLPIGQLSSPYIEHVLQQFALLFSRIGVADVAEHFARSCLQKLESIMRP